MACERIRRTPVEGLSLSLLDLSDGALLTILSFSSLDDVAQLAQCNRYLHRLVHKDVYRLRDAAMIHKSRAPTSRQRLHRWAKGESCLDNAISAFFRNEATKIPKHVLLTPTATSETMLCVYSIKQQSVLWQGFLPWATATTSLPGGWHLDVAPLRSMWAHLLPRTGTTTASLEQICKVVDDLVFALAVVDGGTRLPRAHLVTCTNGVALSQRQHGNRMPSSFVLRQQRVEAVPVVVHLALHTSGNILESCQISYFSVR